VLHGVVGFDEAAETLHNGGAVEEFAEEVNLFAELLVRDGLDEFFGGDAGFGVELGDLLGHGTRDFERVAFAGEMRDEAGLVPGFGFDCAAREKQIADEAVANVAAETGNAAEAGDETEAKFGKAKARHFVGNDQIAEESEFQAASHAETVNGGESDKRRGVYGVCDFVDAFDEFSQARDAFLWRKIQRVVVKLFQIAADAEAAGAGAGDDAGTGDGGEAVDGGDELLQFTEKQGADFVEGFVVESEFDDPVAPLPAESFASEFLH